MKTNVFKSIIAVLVFGMAMTMTSLAKTPEKNVVQIAVDDSRFSTLVEAVTKAGLVDALTAEGPYTVFAPTNDAFDQLFNSMGIDGIEDLTAEQLKPILLYHVVSGKVMSSDVQSGSVPTLNPDASIMVDVSKKGVMINKGSKVIITDIEGTNGVIHVINKVLVPSMKTADAGKTGSCN